MDGFGLRYITPYALALGSNNFHIGLLNSIPSLLGNLSQLLTLKFMDKWSRKKITFIGVLLQSIMWLFLIALGSIYFIFKNTSQLTPNLLIIIYTILILVGSFSGPAWMSWMKDLITNKRGEYFGKRSRIASIVAITCTLIAGFILDYFKNSYLFAGFIIIFFIAFLGRLCSSLLILRQYEPKYKQDESAYFSIFSFIKKMIHNNFGRFVLYYSLTSLTTTIASPFFAVLMLKELNFSYAQYMIISLSATISSLMFIPLWGKFADKYGNVEVMKITGRVIFLIPLLWFCSYIINLKLSIIYVILYLFFTEFFSGFIWSGFNLSAGNFIYDAVSRQRLAICGSYFNIINSFGILVGSTIGGLIATMKLSLFSVNMLLWTFIISAFLRLAVYYVFKNKIVEVRPVKTLNKKREIQEVERIAFQGLNIKPIVKFFEFLDFSFLTPKR